MPKAATQAETRTAKNLSKAFFSAAASIAEPQRLLVISTAAAMIRDETKVLRLKAAAVKLKASDKAAAMKTRAVKAKAPVKAVKAVKPVREIRVRKATAPDVHANGAAAAD